MPTLTSNHGLREALRRPGSLLADLAVVGALVSLLGGLLAYGSQVTAPLAEKTEISLSVSALPLYTFFSLCRGFAAYAVSLAFTLVFATTAVQSRRAERVMMPILDVLQSIPVLGFLPGLVLGMIALFPTREVGLEVACIIMIFTGQAWNMTFSLYGSLKGIPKPLREVALVFRLPRWRAFRLLEIPASMIGLVWNSMMSMAGGWFFLSVNEAFTLGDKDFRLPGIGSFMAEAIKQDSVHAMFAAIVAMIVMIVATDQLLWRPVVAWSERFKLEETAGADKPKSWFLSVLERSRLVQWLAERRRARRKAVHVRLDSRHHEAAKQRIADKAWKAAKIALIGIGCATVGWGAWAMLGLLVQLPLRNARTNEDWLTVGLSAGATFLRTAAAVLIGAAWTVPVGILIGLSPKWSQRLQPFVQIVASFPAPMIFPLAVLCLNVLHFPFSIGCVFLMLLGTQWYILFNVIAGAMSIPNDLKDVGRMLGASRWNTWKRLYLPSVFPHLVTGLVSAAGGAWNASIVSEFVQVKDETYAAFGLGSLISEATANGRFALLAASILAMAGSVVLINRVFWKRLFRLAERKYALEV